MADRQPIVLVSGAFAELPPGDGIIGASVTLISNPSGLYTLGGELGYDGTAITALASGNAALSDVAGAVASGNAALVDSGSVVYVSGAVILAASAASGTISDAAYAVGITTVSGNAGATVPVVTDEIATVDSQNITHQSTLTPGRYYYLSTVPGQVTLIEPSGITVSGGFQASTLVGMALTQSDIHLEIDGPVFLTL